MTGEGQQPMTLPSDVSSHVSRFDRFAGAVTAVVSRAAFFAAAVALVVIWLPSYWLFRDVNTWQLIINTATTIGTWLLVALLQNSQTRADQATQHKLNAVAGALADFMAADRNVDPGAIRELRRAVGLEHRESS